MIFYTRRSDNKYDIQPEEIEEKKKISTDISSSSQSKALKHNASQKHVKNSLGQR
jgi:hypothetical protein